MGYYATGNSMTGYYGDPSFWGAIGGAIKGAISGFATTGGPWGAAIGAIGGAVQGSHGTASAAVSSSAPMPGGSPTLGGGYGYTAGHAAGTVVRTVGRIVSGHPVLTGAAAAGTAVAAGAIEHYIGRGAAAPVVAAPGGGVVSLKGYHMSKPRVCMGQVIPSHPVRNRRMNPFNPHALRRAARRAHGFLRMSRKLVHYYTPHAHKGKAYIRARKRK